MIRHPWIIGISVFVILALGAGWYLDRHSPELMPMLAGKACLAGSCEGPNGGKYNPAAAPELTGLETWLNSSPLTLAELRGKVVLVDFWTYSCVNCIHTLPYVQAWHETYKDEGFVVIGVHTPEFAFERELKNVKDATKRFGLTYPIALDNKYATWNAYGNQYWPAHYLINQDGQIVYTHFGEGNYDVMEKKIQELLADSEPS